jgi:hypothetical protein
MPLLVPTGGEAEPGAAEEEVAVGAELPLLG